MMNKLHISILTGLAVAISGCASTGTPSADYMKMDVEKMCSVKANGIDNVIATAEKYNNIAIQEKVEFRRLGVNNKDLIISVQEAIKSGAKEVNPKDYKGKASKTKLPTAYAAERACKFGISALAFKQEAKSTWRAAVPGDGFKY